MAQRSDKEVWENIVFQCLMKYPQIEGIFDDAEKVASDCARLADTIVAERAKRFPERSTITLKKKV